MTTTASPRPSLWAGLRETGRSAVIATKWLVIGAGTAALALFTVLVLVGVALLSLVGIGLLLLRPALGLLRWVADLERRRLEALGRPVQSPYGPLPTQWQSVWRTFRTDPGVRRDLGWLPLHATLGLVLGLLPLELLSNAVQELTTPAWWWLLPSGETDILGGFLPVETWAMARWGVVTGLSWAIVWFAVAPLLLRWQTAPGRQLLAPHPEVDLSARVAHLTATRAAALDAHAVELRRIERALHDGAQNRLVAVAVLAGAARQALERDPASAGPLLARVQDGTETALAELRSVVRSILPPVLESRGLAGALTALAAESAVPTEVDAQVEPRAPLAVEAVAYFAVAEALTNVAKHSEAGRATVRVHRQGDLLVARVADDGVGGAVLRQGSGLAGIRDRVQAHDGSLTVDSPPDGPTLVEVVLPCG